jgi:hypothetical protein
MRHSVNMREFIIVITPDPIFRFFRLSSALAPSTRWRVGISCDYWDEAVLKGVCPFLTNSIACSGVQVRRFPTVHVQKR